MRKNKLTHLITYVMIPAFLLGVWIVASLFFNNKFSFSVLTYSHPKNDIVSSPADKLFKGQKIRGEFKARENHLGVLILKFNSFVKYDFSGEDILIFRIKEKGEKAWYHSNSFRSGILQNQLHFPFGFPLIDNSKGKVYEFEIESINGNTKNAAELNSNNPGLVTGYQFPRSEIVGSKRRAVEFMIKKTMTSFTNVDFLLSSLIYLIPFLIYVFGIKKIIGVVGLKNFEKYFTLSTILLILVDIVLLREFNTGLQIILILGWFFSIKLSRLDSTVSFAFALSLLLFWILVIVFGVDHIQNKLNIWVYIFLVFGLIQSVIEEKGKFKKRLKFHELATLFKLK